MSRAAKYLAGGAMLGISVVAFGALIAAPQLLPGPVPLDPETLCPTDRPIAGHTIVLVDRTERFSKAQLEVLRRTIARVRGQLAVHERLSIHLLTADPGDAATPLLSLCNPGDGKAVDPVTGNPRRARERFEESFAAPLDRILKRLAQPREAPHSPIIEAVTELGWADGFDPGLANRRLVVVSDLLQNVPGQSHYRELPNVETVLHSTAGQRLAAAGLGNVRIALVYLRNPRAALRQGPDHLAFWRQLLARIGANPVVVKR